MLSSTATASPFPTQGDFGTELLKLQAQVDFLPDWIWNVPVDPQLYATEYPRGMCPHSPPILSMNSLFFYVYVEAVSKALSQYTFLAPWLDSHAGMDPNPYSEVAGWNFPQVDRFAKLLLFPSDHCQDDTKRN